MASEVKVEVRQLSESASEGQARNFRVICDRSEEKGGGNAGPSGGELFLFALGGCFMGNLLAAIKARKSTISDVNMSITAQVDGTPPRVTDIALKIAGNYQSREELEKLVVIAERGCLVANTLKAVVNLQIEIL